MYKENQPESNVCVCVCVCVCERQRDKKESVSNCLLLYIFPSLFNLKVP